MAKCCKSPQFKTLGGYKDTNNFMYNTVSQSNQLITRVKNYDVTKTSRRVSVLIIAFEFT